LFIGVSAAFLISIESHGPHAPAIGIIGKVNRTIDKNQQVMAFSRRGGRIERYGEPAAALQNREKPPFGG
jgi:hypothetical protein